MRASARCGRVAASQPRPTIDTSTRAGAQAAERMKGAEPMLTSTTTRLPQQIFTWALRKETWLHRRLQQAMLRTARAQAFAQFAEAHPRWAESLFDQHFLSHAAAPLIARAVEPGNRP